jgi:hypothetical protein
MILRRELQFFSFQVIPVFVKKDPLSERNYWAKNSSAKNHPSKELSGKESSGEEFS